MRLIALPVAALLLAALVLPTSPAAFADHSAAGGSRATAHGAWLTDSTGRVVVAQGVNMVAKTAPYAPDADGFGADDVRFLQRSGFDVVRLGILWQAVEPKQGVYDDGYLRRIGRTVRLLAAHGIWTLLDMHQDLYSHAYGGEGAPAWAVDDDGLPNLDQAGFPWAYFSDPAVWAAFDNLWSNADGLATDYDAMWAHVASYVRGLPRVLGFDLFNEPWPGSGWATCVPPAGCPLLDARMQAFDQGVIDAVRHVDPRTTLFYEPSVMIDYGAPTYVAPSGSNLGFSFHDYCTSAAGTPVAGLVTTGCDTLTDQDWRNIDAHLAQTHQPGLLTEFGATNDTSVLTSMVDRADAAGDGWTYWAYCGCDDPTTTGPGNEQALVLDPHKAPTGSNVDRAKLRALEVPHPIAVAGTPTSYGFDRSTRVFTMVWATARASGHGTFGTGSRTTAWAAPIVYHGRYRVSVRGARVVSRPGAARLVLAESRGAKRISLTITPMR